MARLEWNAIGERFFEAGVDRGVLYVEGFNGVPWNGLISVSECPSGGEIESHYIDGVKVFDHLEIEEYNATIEAYTYPEEFGPCEGIMDITSGLFSSQHSKKSFGLAYRTKIGNDLEGLDHGYKLHLVYNAKASPTERANNTIVDTIEPFSFSWEIVTKAPNIRGVKPSSHYMVDSRKIHPDLLVQIENVLYGTEEVSPRLPSPQELLFIFASFVGDGLDAGTLVEQYFFTYDAGEIPKAYATTFDGGGP